MKMNLIDLTHTLVNGRGAYPGASTPEFSWHSTFESKGRTSSLIRLSTHNGTHIDAPLHFIQGSTPIDQVSLTRLCGVARVIDLSHARRNRRVFSETDFYNAAENFQLGEIPLIYTGVDALFGQPAFLSEMASLSLGCIQWLVEKGISVYGTDAYSVDLLDTGDFSNHKVLLGAGIPIIEALNNLGVLPKEPVFFCALSGGSFSRSEN
jgi:arylformamidase